MATSCPWRDVGRCRPPFLSPSMMVGDVRFNKFKTEPPWVGSRWTKPLRFRDREAPGSNPGPLTNF
jgi:hypothetical protein